MAVRQIRKFSDPPYYIFHESWYMFNHDFFLEFFQNFWQLYNYLDLSDYGYGFRPYQTYIPEPSTWPTFREIICNYNLSFLFEKNIKAQKNNIAQIYGHFDLLRTFRQKISLSLPTLIRSVLHPVQCFWISCWIFLDFSWFVIGYLPDFFLDFLFFSANFVLDANDNSEEEA